ncbi:MAG: ABC transporter permease [Chloroflexi bacterium]|nr:ABC transporter permease [Chloroflexota bacterium]
MDSVARERLIEPAESADAAAALESAAWARRRGRARGMMATLLGRALATHRVQVSGAVILLAALVAILAPLISPYDPILMDPPVRLKPPTLAHPMGTDEFGRDVLSRLFWGARVSLFVGSIGVILSAIGGVALGMLAGYIGGRVDWAIMRTMDVILCFPPILLAIAVVGFAGHGLENVVLVIGFLYVPRFARVVYGSVQSVKQNAYVEATRAIGGGHLYIMRMDILPNIFALILIQITLNFGFMILLEAGLSFLGLGAVPPTPSWGTMIASARDYMEMAPFLVVGPSIAVATLVLAFNLLGDGLRDALDPKLIKG